MDSRDVKQEETQNKDKKNEKGRQNILLMALVAMLGVFSYLYFFTDIIRPQGENKPVDAPVAQAVKKPLPPREDAAGKTEVKPAAEGQKAAEAPAKTEAPKAEPAKTVAAPPAATVAAQQPKAAEEPKKAEVAKPAEKKVAAAPAAKEQKKPADTKKVTAKPVKKDEPASSGRWTVLVGNYVIEANLAADQAKIKKAGLEPVIKPGTRKKSMMNRLFLAEYADRSAAKTALEKLRKHTSDAFILDQAGKHYVYAGSYILDSRAASEKDRLASAGFALSLKREEVSIPSKNLSAGVFNDKKAAEAAVKKLKDAGLKATLKQ